MKPLSTLVLGVGGNVGQGILKALKLSTTPHRVIGACISPLAVGLYTTDRSFISPYFYDPKFMQWLTEICQAEQVNVILTGVEPILTFLATHQADIFQKTGATVVTSDPEQLLIATDKFTTCVWLRDHDFPYPRFALASDSIAVQQLKQQCRLPLLAKPRFGRGGSGIIMIKDDMTLQYVMNQTDYLIQEYIGDAESEYTVGCFCNRHGILQGTIVMKRELLEGTTYRAQVGLFPDVRAEAERIVRVLQPKGPCNLQMRTTTTGQPICFEINMRFSGTTPLRARFGFNEVQAALDCFVFDKTEIHLPKVTTGIALRYWNEIYIEQDAHHTLNSTGQLSNPQQFNLQFETYGQS